MRSRSAGGCRGSSRAGSSPRRLHASRSATCGDACRRSRAGPARPRHRSPARPQRTPPARSRRSGPRRPPRPRARTSPGRDRRPAPLHPAPRVSSAAVSSIPMLPTWPPGTPAMLCVSGPHAIPVSSYVRGGRRSDHARTRLQARDACAPARRPGRRLLRAGEGRCLHRTLQSWDRAGIDGGRAEQHGGGATCGAGAGSPCRRPHGDPRRGQLALDRRRGRRAPAADLAELEAL